MLYHQLHNKTMRRLEKDWRRHGKARRRELLRQDVAEGSTRFVLSPQCSIKKYFTVSARVLSQFRDMYETRSNMEEVYVMGHRLIVFLDEALPQHPEYRSSKRDIDFLREKSRTELDWIRNRLDVVALRVDEEKLNQFILNDLVGSNKYAGARRQSLSPPKSRQRLPESQCWESFSGWATLANNTSNEIAWEEAHDVSFESSDLDESYEETEMEKYEGDHADHEAECTRVAIVIPKEAEYSFLHRIAKEEVVYDNDSEAADSWDQNSEDVELPRPRLLHRRALQDLVNLNWKRPREDPPGISFSKINCFTTFRQNQQEEKSDSYMHDGPNKASIDVPFDEEDRSPPSRFRFNDDDEDLNDDQTLLDEQREAIRFTDDNEGFDDDDRTLVHKWRETIGDLRARSGE